MIPFFRHFELGLLNPAFDSPLVDVITELEHLRRLHLTGTTVPIVFTQIKQVFHWLESLASARIEGNHTTLADYIEQVVERPPTEHDHLHEILNIEQAMLFIEERAQDETMSEHFIRTLHALTVRGLKREGDDTPGAYRTHGVKISQSEHLPPEAIHVSSYMQELVDFINQPDPAKYDLMKVALAHHRFGWIHPFGNGNGRVVRLITYAQLIQYGFNVASAGRLLNPTAIFCNDRSKYYRMLSCADTGTQEGLEAWCLYVLSGILQELKKLEHLTDHEYLLEKIFKPALSHGLQKHILDQVEYNILVLAAEKQIIKSSDIKHLISDSRARTYQISKMVNNKLLLPIHEGARQYCLGFTSNYLLRGVIGALRAEGFISDELAG